MKKILLILLSVTVFSGVFISCSEDDGLYFPLPSGNNYFHFPSSKPYVIMTVNDKSFWQTDNFNTCYVKIPSLNNTEWFDIVMTSSPAELHSHGNVQEKYLFIHAENPLVKTFSFDDTVKITNGLKIIYYEGKEVEDNHATYKKYFTNCEGTLTVTENNGEFMCGNFDGTIQDIMNKQQYNIHIIFNKIPVSLVK